MRPEPTEFTLDKLEFQFTHPVWGATLLYILNPPNHPFQFTHPVWGATPTLLKQSETLMFQFTHPVWGATGAVWRIDRIGDVSIHAPRVGCDSL